jgi:hypothetical protein
VGEGELSGISDDPYNATYESRRVALFNVFPAILTLGERFLKLHI